MLEGEGALRALERPQDAKQPAEMDGGVEREFEDDEFGFW